MRFTRPVIPSHPSAPARRPRRPSPEPVRKFPSGQAPPHQTACPRSLLSSHFPEPRLVSEGGTTGAESPPARKQAARRPGPDGSGPGRALAPRRLAAPRSPALQPQLRFHQTYSKVGPKWRRRSRGRAPRRLSAPPSGGRVLRRPQWAGGAAYCRRPLAPRAAPGPRLGVRAPLPGPAGSISLRRSHARERRRSFLPRGNSISLSPAAGRSSRAPGSGPRHGSVTPCRHSRQLLARRQASAQGDLATLRRAAWGLPQCGRYLRLAHRFVQGISTECVLQGKGKQFSLGAGGAS